MCGDGWKLLKVAGMPGNGWKLLKMPGNCWNAWKQLEMAGNYWKRPEMTENCLKRLYMYLNVWKLMGKAEHGWNGYQ